MHWFDVLERRRQLVGGILKYRQCLSDYCGGIADVSLGDCDVTIELAWLAKWHLKHWVLLADAPAVRIPTSRTPEPLPQDRIAIRVRPDLCVVLDPHGMKRLNPGLEIALRKCGLIRSP